MLPIQVFGLLGHNGAGKTTLFNMLTGMTPITKGKATVFGFHVNDQDDLDEIRSMTGICPQHDILFDDLTPREHLEYFARIRGVKAANIEDEVNSTIADINLADKTDTIVKKLSGGQKRKLSVGIALIGDPKLVFLDEPTSGVDPLSRRHLWEVLRKRKHDKVINFYIL